MNSTTTYQQTLTLIRTFKPHLLTSFHRLLEYCQKRMVLDDEMIKAVGQLTIASEHLYINRDAILSKVIEKNELSSFSRILYELANAGPTYGQLFLSHYSRLPFALASIEESIVEFAEKLLLTVHKPQAILSFCLNTRESRRCTFLFSQFSTIASIVPGATEDIFEVIESTFSSILYPVLEKWLSRGTDLLTSNRIEEGILFLKMLSEESRRMLGLNHVSLEDVKRVLTIYLSSIAGRSVSVQNLELSSFSITSAYTDGKSIFLPAQIHFFNDPDFNKQMYTVIGAVQAAFIRMDTFRFNLEEIDFREELQRQYGSLIPNIMENVRSYYRKKAKTIRERRTGEIEVIFPSERTLRILESDHEQFFYLFPTPDFIRELFFLIETARIEYLLARRYPGLRQDLEIYNRYLWKKRPYIRADAQQSLYDRFVSTVEALQQFVLSGEWKYQSISNELETLLDELVAEVKIIYRENTTVYDTARASFHIYTIFFEHFPLVAYCNRSDVRELFAGSGKTSVFPEIIAETSPELFHTRKKQVQQEQLDTSEEQDVDLTSLSRSEKKARELRQALIQGSLAIYRHPEYNVFTAGYQKKYCTVFESYLESTDNDYYDSIIKAHRQLYRRIKKRFLFLQPEEVEITRKWLDGNDIHIADAVDYATDFMRGTFLDEKIYMRKKQNVRDIVAAIVTDASSSTDEKIGGKRIIDIEMTALSLLSSALSLIGDRFALFTFFSMGRQNVFFNIIKDFHEPWNNHTQARVSSVKAIAGNRDGAAIRHTVMKLLQQPEKTKLMILLSDGIPADTGYGTSDGAETNRYAIEDTRRAVIEARMQGVIPFCITIDRAAKKYIPHLYGDYHYAVLPDVMLLPEKLSRLYVKLTK